MITVLTQNIWGGGPLWGLRGRRLARRIASLGPDLVGLQEVHARTPDGQSSQAHEVVGVAGDYHVLFAPGRIARSGRCEGVAIASRHPIVEHSVRRLSCDRGDLIDRISPRVVLRALVDLPGGVLEVYVTHLSLTRRARIRTMTELLEFASSERSRSPRRAAVLMGDLNAAPGDPSLSALRAAGWIDAWHASGGAIARGGTFPALAPCRRIDHVFVRPAQSWTVKGCRREAAGCSDHLGVVAFLELQGDARESGMAARQDGSPWIT